MLGLFLLTFLLVDCRVCGSPTKPGAHYCTSCGLPTDWAPSEEMTQPGNAGDWFLRGCARASRGEFSEALRDLDRALALDPLRKEFWLRRGCVRLKGSPSEEDCRAAVDDFAHAIRLDPKQVAARRGRAEALARIAEFQEDPAPMLSAAALHLEDALALAPADAQSWLRLGEVRLHQKRAVEALAASDEAIRLDPCGAAFLLRSRVRETRKEWNRALEDADEAVRRTSDDPAPRLQRGAILVELARLPEAVDAFSEAARLRPSDFEPWLRCGQARLGLDSREERAKAVADLTRALSLRPNDVAALLARGQAYFVLEDLQAAAADWRRALDLAPYLRNQIVPWIETATRKRGRP